MGTFSETLSGVGRGGRQFAAKGDGIDETPGGVTPGGNVGMSVGKLVLEVWRGMVLPGGNSDGWRTLQVTNSPETMVTSRVDTVARVSQEGAILITVTVTNELRRGYQRHRHSSRREPIGLTWS